jgi:iron complex transport system ATP-binding protein
MASNVRLENTAFSYGEKEVFHGISLEVHKGEMLSILGSNGCGKTTLLKCIQGELRLKDGRIWLEGKDLSSLTPVERARKIGMVFQEHSALFPYPVLEVVRMGRTPHLGFFARPGVRDTDISERALERVGIVHLKEKAYTQISGGERQLVLIARTLAQEPEVMLLDEPTSHLDFKNQILVLKIMERLSKEGLSIIMTSHYPNHAFLFSSRIALMAHGKFHAVGGPEEVISPENLGAIYGMQVRILTANDPESGDIVKFCVPVRKDPHEFTPT